MGMLDGKAIVITGSGRGLGRGYAIEAALAGASVVINDIDQAPADDVAAEIVSAGGRAVAHAGSVSDWDQSEALIARCVSEFGRIDGLVNNAGLAHYALPQDETPEGIRQMVDVNVVGVIVTATHAMRAMIAQGSGTIVNVTSGAHQGISTQGVYGATKGAVASATYSWAIDLAPHGIRVNAISPLAMTRMADNMPASMAGVVLPDPSAIAPLMIFMLSDGADFTGQVLRLDGTTFNVLQQPRYDADAGVTRDSWTAEQIAQAWRDSVSSHSSASGMASYR